MRSFSSCISCAALLLSAACGPGVQDPVAPVVDATTFASEASADNASGFVVYPFQIRPDEQSASTAWGEMVVRIGTGVPPNPCDDGGEVLGGPLALTFCGVLHNPAGETLESIQFTLSDPDGAPLPVRLQFEYPPSPCTTALFRGALDLVAYPSPGPPNTELRTDAGLLIAWPDPGPPDYPNPGPPNLPDPGPPACEIGIQTAR